MTSEASSTNESDEPLPEQRIAPETLRVDKDLLTRLLGQISLAERDLRAASVNPGMYRALQRADDLSRARQDLEASISSETTPNREIEDLINSVDSLVAR